MSSPDDSNPKRFYKAASAEPFGDAWTVTLDERTVKTPARQQLLLPTQRLAQAIAAEWNAQGDRIDIAAMPLTRLANVALDRAPETREEMADELARYCETDLICHLAEDPQELRDLEESHWAPIRVWAEETYDIHLIPVDGIIASPQPDASLEAARFAALDMEDFQLTGLLFGCGLFGSALLALATAAGAISAEDAFEVSRIDEAFQAENWGEDEEAKEALDIRRTEAKALGVWIRALAA